MNVEDMCFQIFHELHEQNLMITLGKYDISNLEQKMQDFSVQDYVELSQDMEEQTWSNESGVEFECRDREKRIVTFSGVYYRL